MLSFFMYYLAKKMKAKYNYRKINFCDINK